MNASKETKFFHVVSVFFCTHTAHAHAHAHAIFVSTTTKPLPDLAANTDYVTLTLTAFTTTPICKIALAWD